MLTQHSTLNTQHSLGPADVILGTQPGRVVPEPAVPLTEYNRSRPGTLQTGRPPVIYEARFRREGVTRT